MRWGIADLGIIRWAAWYLGKGLSAAKVVADVARKWGHLGEARSADVVSEALDSLTVAKRFKDAGPDTVLSELTGGRTPPSELVSVSVAFSWFDASGRVHHATVKVPTHWGATKGEVLADAWTLFSGLSQQYDVYTSAQTAIVGGIWTPSDEQT